MFGGWWVPAVMVLATFAGVGYVAADTELTVGGTGFVEVDADRYTAVAGLAKGTVTWFSGATLSERVLDGGDGRWVLVSEPGVIVDLAALQGAGEPVAVPDPNDAAVEWTTYPYQTPAGDAVYLVAVGDSLEDASVPGGTYNFIALVDPVTWDGADAIVSVVGTPPDL